MLLATDGEDSFAANADLDAERRAQVGTLQDPSTHKEVSGKIRHLERIEKCAATGIANHGMFRGAEP